MLPEDPGDDPAGAEIDEYDEFDDLDPEDAFDQEDPLAERIDLIDAIADSIGRQRTSDPERAGVRTEEALELIASLQVELEDPATPLNVDAPDEAARLRGRLTVVDNNLRTA